MKSTDLLRGAGLLLLATVAWGGMFPVATSALATLDPYYMTVIRYGVTAIILLALLALIEGRDALRLDGKAARIALLGAFGFAGFGLLAFEGLRHSRPEHGGIIMATQPLIAALVAWKLKRTRPTASTLGFLGIALAGVVLVITKGHFATLFDGGTGWGDLLLFLAALSWIVYTFGAAEFQAWSPLRYTALTTALAMPTILAITLVATATGHVAVPEAAAIASTGWQLLYLIAIASVLAVLSWNAGNKLIGPTNGVLFINFVPITAFAIGIARGQHFTAIEFAGAALVMGALIANNIAARRQTKLLAPGVAIPSTGGYTWLFPGRQSSRRS